MGIWCYDTAKILKNLSAKLGDNVRGKSFIQRGCSPIEERYYGNARIFNEEDKSILLKKYNDNIRYTDITKDIYDSIVSYDDISKMQYIDMKTWLKGDILLKADKMTMANSLELRVPFLDRDVFQVASMIEPEYKITKETTKAILREAFKNDIPEHVVNRRKLGFPVPIRVWLKDELKDWTKYIIETSKTDSLINKKYVLELLEKHCRGEFDYSRKIWAVLIFMIWHSLFIEKRMEL